MCFALSLSAGGCQSAHVTQEVTTKYSGDDPDSQLNFWHELALRHLTSNDDAFHAILLDVDGHDTCASYEARVSALKARGFLPKSFSEPANLAIERGTLGVITVKILDIKGGWVMRVFGPSPRYALREVVYEGIFPPSSPQQTFSGAEFVGVIGQIDDHEKPVTASTSAP
jgi:hypothetical protein